MEKGLTASPSITFGLEEVQTAPKALFASMRRRKKKKRVQQDAGEAKKTSSAPTDIDPKQEDVFESFTHYNSPSSLESAEHELQGWVYEKDIGISKDKYLKITSSDSNSQKRSKLRDGSSPKFG